MTWVILTSIFRRRVNTRANISRSAREDLDSLVPKVFIYTAVFAIKQILPPFPITNLIIVKVPLSFCVWLLFESIKLLLRAFIFIDGSQSVSWIGINFQITVTDYVLVRRLRLLISKNVFRWKGEIIVIEQISVTELN